MTIVQTFLDVFWLISETDAALWCGGFALAALAGVCAWKLVLPHGDIS